MSGLDDLPRLSEVIAAHGLAPRKGLGQNFLLDLNLTRRIARAAGPLEGFTVVEIGPGPGGLTRALLAEGADKVVAIERDERCIAALEEIAAACPGRLAIIAGDALKVDAAAHVDGPARIVANLPYNVATPLIVGWLTAEPWPPWYASITVMVQREVAERIVAEPGTRESNRLAVLAQWRSLPRIVFDVSPRAFVPPPKVTSSVVHFEPRPAPEPPCDAGLLERVTAAAFGQRRKMLRSSLSRLGDAAALLQRTGIAPTLRAEQLSIADFCRLARALEGAAT